MKFSDLLVELRALSLQDHEYVITSSGPLGVRGLRESNDLDLVVTDPLWNTLATKYGVIDKGTYKTILVGNIEIYNSTSLLGNFASFNNQLEKADMIEGYNFLNLEMLIELKTKLGREKDLQDIELIRDYLQNNPK